MSHVLDHELFSAYLDGELTAAEQARVEQLLAADPAARQLVDELRALGTTLQGLPQQKLAEDLSQRVLQIAQRRMLTGADDQPGTDLRAVPAEAPPQSLGREIGWRGMLSRRALVWSGLAVAIALVLMWHETWEARHDVSHVAAAPKRAAAEAPCPATTPPSIESLDWRDGRAAKDKRDEAKDAATVVRPAGPETKPAVATAESPALGARKDGAEHLHRNDEPAEKPAEKAILALDEAKRQEGTGRVVAKSERPPAAMSPEPLPKAPAPFSIGRLAKAPAAPQPESGANEPTVVVKRASPKEPQLVTAAPGAPTPSAAPRAPAASPADSVAASDLARRNAVDNLEEQLKTGPRGGRDRSVGSLGQESNKNGGNDVGGRGGGLRSSGSFDGVMVVQCDVSSEAVGKQTFEALLAQSGVAGQNRASPMKAAAERSKEKEQTRKSSPAVAKQGQDLGNAAQPAARPLMVYVVDATPAQVTAIVDRLNRRPDAFASVSQNAIVGQEADKVFFNLLQTNVAPSTTAATQVQAQAGGAQVQMQTGQAGLAYQAKMSKKDKGADRPLADEAKLAAKSTPESLTRLQVQQQAAVSRQINAAQAQVAKAGESSVLAYRVMFVLRVCDQLPAAHAQQNRAAEASRVDTPSASKPAPQKSDPADHCFLACQAAPDDAAMGPEVHRLVRQLNAATLAQREAAEAKLLEMGPRVLDLLPAANDDTSAEVAQRLGRIRQKLQQAAADAAAQASRVTLDARAMPLSKVLAALGQQTGNRIVDARRNFAPAPPDPKLSVDFDKTPFWKALDAVLDDAGLALYSYGEPEAVQVVARGPGQLPRSGRGAISGPLRIEPIRIVARRDLRSTAKPALTLTLEVAWEPRLRPIGLAHRLAAVKAEDPDGRPIAVEDATAENEAMPGRNATAAEMDLTLVYPPYPVRQIARLRGEFRAIVPGRIETFRFTDLLHAQKKTLRIAGATVTLDEVRKNRENWEVFVRLRFDDAGNALESHRQWVLANEAYLEGPGGKPRIAFQTIGTTERTSDEVGLSYVFAIRELPADFSFVYKAPGSIITKDFPYELRGIKLP